MAENPAGGEISSRCADESRFLGLIGRSLFDVAEQGVCSEDPLYRAVGVAALNALSHRYLSSSSVRERGFLAQSWIFGDKLMRRYPTVRSLVTREDRVAVIGYGREVRSLRGACRELHVTDLRPPETFETVIVDRTITHGPLAVHVHASEECEQIVKAADVVFISASTLVSGTTGDLIRWSRNARLAGLFGPGGSLIPDVFFENGIDFLTSFRITDPARFSDDMINDHDMDDSVRATQTQFLFMQPLARVEGTPVRRWLRQAADF